MNELVGVLGIDTSNYTCSAAFYNTADGSIRHSKQLLPVKSGEKGIRQSDAVFHHTVLLPQMLERLWCDGMSIRAVGVSDRPSCRENSYMPCFMTGLGTARAISLAAGVPYFATTHQTGHILSALYSCGRLDLIDEKRCFLAFHVSGGTTDMLMCEYDSDRLLDIKRIGGSNDLKAGQAIDRCGVMLGLDFPCGRDLEALAEGYYKDVKAIPSVKGLECSLSGIENKCVRLFDSGADKGYIAAYCLKSIEAALFSLTKNALSEYGEMPVIYAGGVMSDRLIAKSLGVSFDAYFADAEYSCDNAAGTAIYAARLKGLI